MKKTAILFCAALVAFAFLATYAAAVASSAEDNYVRLAINGTNVNLRPQPLAAGRVTAQMSAGDVFIAEKQPVFNKNGNSKWYKIALALDSKTGKISVLSEWDPRFKANVAFVHADYAIVSPLAEGDMEKIKATPVDGSAVSASSGSIAGYWAGIYYWSDGSASLYGYYFAENGTGLLFQSDVCFEITSYTYTDGNLSFAFVIGENGEGYEPGSYTWNRRAHLLSENYLAIKPDDGQYTVFNRMSKIEQTELWGGRIVTQLDGSVFELANESGVFSAR